MFSRTIQDYIAKCTNYLVDGSRIGNLIMSQHRYSAEELLQRGLIITSIAVAGFLEQRRQDNYSVGPFVFGASLGFVLSHGIVIAPLVYKRWCVKNECSAVAVEIRDVLVLRDSPFKKQVELLMHEIMNLEGKGASAVWGKRLRLLQVLKDYVHSGQYDPLVDLNALDNDYNPAHLKFN